MARPTTHYANERGTWIVCAVAGLVSLYLLLRFHIAVEPISLMIAMAVVAFLGFAYLLYRHWRPDNQISHLCGALGAIIFSSAMSAVISLIGLRYHAPLVDAHLAAIDQTLGITTTNLVHATASSPFLSQILNIVYESWHIQMLAVVLVTALRQRFERLWTFAFVVSSSILVCTILSVFFPARGAFDFFEYPPDILAGLPPDAGLYHITKFDYFRNATFPVLSFANLLGVVTFPSYHTCLALILIAICVGNRWLLTASLLWNGLMIVSTIPIGGHFATDLIAGAVLWFAMACISAALSRADARQPIPRFNARCRLLRA